MTDRPTAFIYCQHSLGLGHLKRSWTLAAGMTGRFHVVLLTGGVMPRGMAAPNGVEIVRLTALEQSDDGRLIGRRRNGSDETPRILERRRDAMLALYRERRPDVLMIELYPFGRRKFSHELRPLLEEARSGRHARSRPVIVCSLRDILVGRGPEQQAHDDNAQRIADELFDAVLVHADPRLARLEDSFRPRTPLKTPVLYTGFAVDGPVADGTSRRRDLLISAGGGRVGEPLYAAAVDAASRIYRDCRLRTRIVAGPLYPDEAWTRLRLAADDREHVRLRRTVKHLTVDLGRAAASVSQCGYNTALEIIRARTPAIVVPYGEGHEDEQRTRARRLAELGVVRVLEPHRLSASTLADAVAGLEQFTPAPVDIDLNGAGKTARLLAAMVAGTAR